MKERGKNGRFIKKNIDKEWLYQKYFIERKSVKYFIENGIWGTALYRALKEFGITRKRIAWNKETKGIIKPNQTSFKKGEHHGVEFGKDRKIKGENHPNWKGGITPKYISERMSEKMKIFKKQILERDNYTCQECGQRGGRLEVHHIKSFAFYPEERYNPDNCITLCKNCHKKTDNYLNKARKIEASLAFA